MKRSELEKYIGKKVEVVLFDGTSLIGKLETGNGFFQAPKLYHILDETTQKGYCFRSSHVKKLHTKGKH